VSSHVQGHLSIVVICGTGQMRPDYRGDPNSMTDFLYFILYGTHL